MTWTPTKQQLEDAARAGGRKHKVFNGVSRSVLCVQDSDGYNWDTYVPHLPTTQGKADLLDLMLELDVSFSRNGRYIDIEADVFIDTKDIKDASVLITNNDKHAALARAVIEVAAQVGAKMRGEV